MNTSMMLILTAILVTGTGILLTAYMNSLWNDNTAKAYLYPLSVSNNNNYGGFDYDSKNLKESQYLSIIAICFRPK
jgi:hypothetical protein